MWFFDGVFAGGILSFLKLGQKILFVCRSAQFYFAILENSFSFCFDRKRSGFLKEPVCAKEFWDCILMFCIKIQLLDSHFVLRWAVCAEKGEVVVLYCMASLDLFVCEFATTTL